MAKIIDQYRTKVALIDGLPLYLDGSFKVIYNSSIKYSWGSDFFGIPEYRMHGKRMVEKIVEANSKAEIFVFPFYPLYNSVFKNYNLLAESIKNAVDLKCNIICICLEVLKVKYLSSEILKAYQYAYKKGVTICVSAGNSRLLKNPLIHKKYTLPVIGVVKTNKVVNNLNIEDSNFIMYNDDNVLLINKNKKINCSLATSYFAGWLSKKIDNYKENIKANDLLKLIYKNYEKQYRFIIATIHL